MRMDVDQLIVHAKAAPEASLCRARDWPVACLDIRVILVPLWYVAKGQELGVLAAGVVGQRQRQWLGTRLLLVLVTVLKWLGWHFQPVSTKVLRGIELKKCSEPERGPNVLSLIGRQFRQITTHEMQRVVGRERKYIQKRRWTTTTSGGNAPLRSESRAEIHDVYVIGNNGSGEIHKTTIIRFKLASFPTTKGLEGQVTCGVVHAKFA